MAVMFQFKVFWVVMPCSVVVGYQHFRGPCCLYRVKMEEAWTSETLVSYPGDNLLSKNINTIKKITDGESNVIMEVSICSICSCFITRMQES
jgi:hypothetical protein